MSASRWHPFGVVPLAGARLSTCLVAVVIGASCMTRARVDHNPRGDTGQHSAVVRFALSDHGEGSTSIQCRGLFRSLGGSDRPRLHIAITLQTGDERDVGLNALDVIVRDRWGIELELVRASMQRGQFERLTVPPDTAETVDFLFDVPALGAVDRLSLFSVEWSYSVGAETITRRTVFRERGKEGTSWGSWGLDPGHFPGSRGL